MPPTSATSHPDVLLIEAGDLRDALESIRQTASLGDSSLRNLVLVWQRVEAARPTASTDALDTALRDVLFEIIGDNLIRLRRLEGLSGQDIPDTRKAQLAALANDYTWANPELEAWSTLYYRYVRLDLNLQVQDMAWQVSVDPRQVRRRLVRGIRRLGEALGTLESAARDKNRRLWLRLKLPLIGYGTLFGAENAISDLVDILSGPGPPWLVVVAGAGGLGKTTLAHAALYQIVEEDAFADLAWVTLNESSSYPALLGTFARQLGYPHIADEAPADLERSLRALLSATRTVLILDNADLLENYPANVERLSALVKPGKILLIVRHWPGSETPVHIVTLDPLPRETTAAFIHHLAQTQQIDQAELLSSETLDRLYDSMGGNPLAVRLVLGQLAHLPLPRVLYNLGSLRTDQGIPLFQELFARTWETLSDDAHQLALALLIIPNEGAFWQDLLLVADLPEGALDAAITELTGRALLEALGPAPRYAVHALTRRFLEQLVTQQSYAPIFEGLLKGALERATDLFEARGTGEYTPSLNIPAWLQLLRWQAKVGVEPDLLGTLVTRVAPAARRSGRWQQWAAVLEQAAPRLTDDDLARIRLETGVALRWLGDSADAEQALEDAIAGFGERGDFVAQAEALIELGALCAGSGRRQEAILAYRRAVAAAERYTAHDGLRRALNGLAMLALQDGDFEEALNLLRRALDLSPDQPDAQTLSNLGVACLRAGLAGEAVSFQQEALGQYETSADVPNRARAHVRLASAHAGHQKYDLARHHFEEGLALMRALGDALGQARTLVNLGAAHRQQDQSEDAILVWHDALALQRHLGDEVGMAYTWYNLGDVQWATGDELAARESLIQAVRLAEAIRLSTLLDTINTHPALQA
jgi:tetratricopeptide (TPR) repeat protein